MESEQSDMAAADAEQEQSGLTVRAYFQQHELSEPGLQTCEPPVLQQLGQTLVDFLQTESGSRYQWNVMLRTP